MLCYKRIVCKCFLIIISLMIFRSLLSKVMNRLADLSPVKNLIKYILDRTLNEFLSDQIQIEDFKDVGDGKLLLLTNISFNRDKINRESLLSSPYILHAGTLGKLKIKLPNWSELASKSIQLSAEQLVLDLKPNKKFAENFKEAMKEQQENVIIQQMEEPGEISENSPLDFFRQLVKQMLLNMLIKFDNVVIRLFINEPSEKISTKPQYYLMFRVPLLTFGKAEDSVPSKEDIQSVRFDSVLPQLSVQLLRQGVQYPQFANEKAQDKDFPFTYPTLGHPGTLLVMGKSELSKQNAAKLRLTLTTNYASQKKDLSIEGRIGSIQATIDPIQLKIMSRFIVQIQQFQKVFKSVMVELGLVSLDNLGVSRQSVDFNLSRHNSGGHKTNTFDLFSSVVMSINEPNKHPNKHIDLYASIATKPELKGAANNFNQQVCKQLKDSGQELPEQSYKNINFKQELSFSFNLGQLQLNLLKYVSPIAYERGWSVDRSLQFVNTSLGCSHFRGQMRELNYSFCTGDNKHKVTMRFVILHDVKLPNPNLVHNQVESDEFFQIDSSTFYNQCVNQDYFTSQPELLQFKLTGKEHFCMEQLLRVSDGACPPLNTATVRRYAFMSDHPGGKEEGLSLIFNSHKKVLKIQVKEVAVMANFQIWKDVLNIIYPIFLYKQLVSKTTINGQPIHYQEQTEHQIHLNPFQSAYVFTGNFIEEVEAREKPVGLLIEVSLIYCLYRQTSAVLPNQHLISQVDNKVYDYDNFSQNCFCNVTERALYAQVYGFVLEKQKQNLNMEVKQIKTGFLSLKNSISSDKNIEAFLVVEGGRMEENRHSQNGIRTRVYLPKVKFSLELDELITFIDMMKKVIGTVDSLQAFKKNLSSKIVFIEMDNGKIVKTNKQKVKKDRIFQIFSEQISLKTILINTCIRSLFYRKESHHQQIKINSFAIGTLNHIQTSLAQFRHDIFLTRYPHTQAFPGINDTALILELGRNCTPIIHKATGSESRNRVARKLQFFDSLFKQHFSLSVFLLQKTQAFERKSQEKKFQFNKNTKKLSKNSLTIQEQKHSKNIQILLGCPLYIYLGNVAYLFRQKSVLEGIAKRVSTVLEEIKRDSIEIMMPERKESIESIEEEGAQLTLKIKGGQIIIDIRPQFQFDPAKNHRILSNTRMIVQINLNKLFLTLCSQSKQATFDSAANLEIFFLHHQDINIETNPINIPMEELKSLGFRSVAKIGQMILVGDYSGRTELGSIEVGIDDIALSLCLSSVPALELFWEHFLKHSLGGDFGIGQNQFEVLEQEIEQLELIDNQEMAELQKKIEERRDIQKGFESAEFSVRPDLFFKGIHLKKLVIARLAMNFYAGKQFAFVECNSLYESKAKVRTWSWEPDHSHYISLIMEKFTLQAAISSQTRTFFEFDRLFIDYCFRRTEGLMWKQQKSYNVSLLRIKRPLKVLMHIGEDYLRVKLNHIQMSLAVTDEIFTLAEFFETQSKHIARSRWKKSYLEEKKEDKERMILLIAPGDLYEGTTSKVSVSVQLKNSTILADRTLHIKRLAFHEPSTNSARINQIIKEWVMSILKDNMGTLLTGAFSEVIFGCIEILFGAVRHTIGFFVPQIRQ